MLKNLNTKQSWTPLWNSILTVHHNLVPNTQSTDQCGANNDKN